MNYKNKTGWCRNCGNEDVMHVDLKCPFDSTDYVQMSSEERRQRIRQYYENERTKGAYLQALIEATPGGDAVQLPEKLRELFSWLSLPRVIRDP